MNMHLLSSRSGLQQRDGWGDVDGTPGSTSDNHSTTYHLATLYLALLSAGHHASEFSPEGRQAVQAGLSALTRGRCRGLGAQRRK